MQLIDTHTHIYLPEFDFDRDESIKRAADNDVVKLLMPNIDIYSVDAMLETEKRYQGICLPMIGLHPTSVKDDYLFQLDAIEKLAAEHIYIGIGEIGIDLYWDKTFINEQIDAFKRQVAFAIETDLPVIIHARESFPEIFATLKGFEGSRLRGVFHAFTGNPEAAEKAVNMRFMLGIGGIVTFKNSGLDRTVKEVGIENIILETDSPYLAPAPFRGKRNESSYLSIVNSKLAEIFDMKKEDTAAVTYSNSVRLFNL